MTKFVGLRAKTYNYLINHGSEDKIAKGAKKCVIKRQLKFENYKNCLEATQVDNKIKYLEKTKINMDSPKRYHKEFIRNNKSTLKAQQRFKNESDNFFTGEINKIVLSSKGDKRIQSIDWIEIYAVGTSKDLVSENEEIKCKNMIRQYKNNYLDNVTKKTLKNIIQIGIEFLIIHTKY